MRVRITVQGDVVTLRGHLESDVEMLRLSEFAVAMKPFGLVIASVEPEEAPVLTCPGCGSTGTARTTMPTLSGEPVMVCTECHMIARTVDWSR